MQAPSGVAQVCIPGFVDHHAHLLKAAAGVPLAASPQEVREFHHRVAGQGRSPMDVHDPAGLLTAPGLPARLAAGLAAAAAAGLVEVTEMGMRSWAYLDALAGLQQAGPLPCRVRIYLASGLAAESGLTELDARRDDCRGWLRLEGVKFYADGWLVPRTCAVREEFADGGDRGVLFTDADDLARRIEPLAGRGWRIATHAIGDRAVRTVLDAYDLAFGADQTAMAAAAPRIEHASVLDTELIDRMADSGVVACIQPSFALTDADQLDPALGAKRAQHAYPWAGLAAAGARMLAGSDYPIEVLEPLPGLARLVTGRSARPGFETRLIAPPQARLTPATAVALMTDPAAGQTVLSSDPRAVDAAEIDRISVLETRPVPF
jgi:predicted amidohydrolase YtcJ